MGSKKVEMLWLCTYLLVCIQFPFQKMSEPGTNIGEIFLYYFILGLFVLVSCLHFFSIASVVQSIVYKGSGYGFSPVIIYPLVIGADRKRPVQLSFDLFRLLGYIFPKKIFIDKTKQNRRNISLIIKRALKYAFLAQEIIGVVAVIASVLSRKYYLAVAFVFLTYSFYELAITDTSQCKGLLVFSKYIESKYPAVFLAQQAILYTNEEFVFYEEFEKLVCEKIPEELLIEILIAIKHVYMIKCVDIGFIYPNKIKEVVREQLVIKHLKEFANADIGEAKLELLKICICYSVLKGDTEMKEWIVKVLREMVLEEQISFLNFQTVQWYLDLVEGKILDKGRCNRPLRKQQFYGCFANYRKNDKYIISQMM